MLNRAGFENFIGGLIHPQTKTLRRYRTVLAAAAAGVVLATATAPGQTVSNIFVIAMENHNFTQPAGTKKPEQILGNPAAPFINSLITPGNPNAAHVSYATAYYNAGTGVHPSEPNYVWAEAGSDFGVHTDSDPAPANGNTFYNQSNHLTAQLDAAGIPWKNYQEDVEFAASPTNSASGNATSANPFNGSSEIGYAVKHNPMAFFADSDIRNVFPVERLFVDLTNGTVGRYNWITPNLNNDAHSALKGGFKYMGSHFTGDQAAVAQGDNFLSIIVPELMASPAYQNNGVIVIWWDETESGDDTNFTLPYIVISPLAKGNAYASSVPLSHSSDIKTWEQVFGLAALNNPIPATETNVFGGFNTVSAANDISDLFVPGAIP